MKLANSQNVPMLTSEHEVRLSASTGTETFGVQGAYSITKSLAVMGEYSYGLDELHSYSGGNWFNYGARTSGEIAIGLYEISKPKDKNNLMSFELFGGVESYHRDFEFIDRDFENGEWYNVNINLIKPFVQGDIGFLNSAKKGFGLSCKVGYMIFQKFEMTETVNGSPNYSKYNYSSTTNIPEFQPCFTYRFGWKRFNFQFQLGASLSDIPTIQIYDFGENPVFFNGGVSLKLFGESSD